VPSGLDVVEHEPLTHPGQSGDSLERVRLRDGTTRLLKHLEPEGDWIAQGSRDQGRDLRFFSDGVFGRMPPVMEPR
jgi:hypothetical protein